jgi:hypothetical protein
VKLNPDTATSTEIRDWLAVDDGWVRDPAYQDGFQANWKWMKQSNGRTNTMGWTHPYPHTLDGAAAAMPLGWTVYLDAVKWDAWPDSAMQTGSHEKTPRTNNEIEDRYRLAMKCRLSERSGK